MKALLVRVAADLSPGGGSWNGPVDPRSGEFAYVAIPENSPVHAGLEKPYATLAPALAKFGVKLPPHLQARHMHLDPDFEQLTYGDLGERGKQIRAQLNAGDRIVFYAGLSGGPRSTELVYAIIGLFVIEQLIDARDICAAQRDTSAHSRRVLGPDARDIVVRGQPQRSGRLERCLPIGEFRDRAYRVRRDLLEAWGGLSVKDGYLQRSGRLPQFLDPDRFLRWLEQQGPVLRQQNN